MAPNNCDLDKPNDLKMRSSVVVSQQHRELTNGRLPVLSTTTTTIVDPLFRDWLPKLLAEKRHLVDVIKSVYQWNITRNGQVIAIWCLDLKSGTGSIYEGPAKSKPDCTITIDEQDSLGMFNGSLDPAKAFVSRKLKINGNLASAHKFQQFWSEEVQSGNIRDINDRMMLAAGSGGSGGGMSAPIPTPQSSSASASGESSLQSLLSSKDDSELMASIPVDGLKSDIVFNTMQQRLIQEPELVGAFKFLIQFNITKNGKPVAVWTVDTKAPGGQVYRQLPRNGQRPDATVTVDDENYVKILFGKLNPQRAFMTGKVVCKGNILLLQKLDQFWTQVQGQRKDPELPMVKDILLNHPLKPGLRSEVVIFDLIQKLVRQPNLMADGCVVRIDITADNDRQSLEVVSKWRLVWVSGQPLGTIERADNDTAAAGHRLVVGDQDFVRLNYNILKLEDGIASGRVQYLGDSAATIVPKLSKLFATSRLVSKL
ncbi:uncharacterized protein LOC128956877 [Oppia nitens]|uniref:uncharacterized protein LOC128956877 n=1 Tax=Oppia nitens TaxID=1686743 RepID=UPI0023DC7A93|nr:uncharacterized protein LOC128956877 [Oppia nitens]XP_054158566.1 uncharacterized protein LOC128956877 [Oppia nitens]